MNVPSHGLSPTCSQNGQSARTALQGYFQGGTVTMTPEPHGGGQA